MTGTVCYTTAQIWEHVLGQGASVLQRLLTHTREVRLNR